jgi:hypothetical protein
MKTIPTLWLAFASGATAEAALCGLFAMFGRFGPCGPGNDVTGILLFIHLPGIRVAESVLPQSGSVELPVVIVVTATLFSVAAFVIISVVRRFYARAKTPAA